LKLILVFSANKKYILSLESDHIVLPYVEYTKNHPIDLAKTTIDYLKDIILVSEKEMIPQLISANEQLIPNKKQDTIDIVYGFIVSLSPSINNSYWVEFDHINTNQYTPLIIKAIQNLS
jgi:hypothetical protein